jgi:hypothetical protein
MRRVSGQRLNPAWREVDAWFMRALSIRQPYAELIMRGEKTIEYRSRPTKLVGERFYIYASKKWAGVQVTRSEGSGQKSDTTDRTLSLTADIWPLTCSFPTGVIVGTAVISKCCPHRSTDNPAPEAQGSGPTLYEWHLTSVKRFKRPRKLPPGTQPQPVWFWPFGNPRKRERADRNAA